MPKILLACGFAAMYLLGNAFGKHDVTMQDYAKRSKCELDAELVAYKEICEYYGFKKSCEPPLKLEYSYRAQKFYLCMYGKRGAHALY